MGDHGYAELRLEFFCACTQSETWLKFDQVHHTSSHTPISPNPFPSTRFDNNYRYYLRAESQFEKS